MPRTIFACEGKRRFGPVCVEMKIPVLCAALTLVICVCVVFYCHVISQNLRVAKGYGGINRGKEVILYRRLGFRDPLESASETSRIMAGLWPA